MSRELIRLTMPAEPVEYFNDAIFGDARTVKGHETTASRSRDLSTRGAGLFGLLINVVDKGIGDSFRHLLLLTKAEIQDLPDLMYPARQQSFLHQLRLGLQLVHRLDRCLILIGHIPALNLDDLRRFPAGSRII